MGECFIVRRGGGTSKFPTEIYIASPPAKTTYTAGEQIDLSGIVVKARYSDSTEVDVTSECVFTPSDSTVVYENTTQIGISWTWKSVVNYTVNQAITVTRVLNSISVTTMPTKTSYDQGESLNLSGMVVTATYTSGQSHAVTGYTTNPTNGASLPTLGSQTVSISYTENGVTKTTSFTVSVNVKIVTWASGTDAEITAMVDAHYAGLIDLHDYWAVGQERTVSLSAMAATGVGESHVAQNVQMVLMHAGGKTLSDGGQCAFIVGQKDGLANGTTGEYGYMNSINTNAGGWDACARRTWCNNVYRNAIPSTLRGIFKQHKNITADGSSTTTAESIDYFALPAEKEVFGSNTYANQTAEASLTQFDYYKTSSNRIKKQGQSGSAYSWWERSPISGYSTYFCSVFSDGSANYYGASYRHLLAPFGCI